MSDPMVRIGNIQQRLASMQPAIGRQGAAYDTYSEEGHDPESPDRAVPADLMGAIEPGKSSFPDDIQFALDQLEALAGDLSGDAPAPSPTARPQPPRPPKPEAGPQARITAIQVRLTSMQPAVKTQGSTYEKYATWAEHPSSQPTVWIPPDLMDALEPGRSSFPNDLEYALDNLDALAADLPSPK